MAETDIVRLPALLIPGIPFRSMQYRIDFIRSGQRAVDGGGASC